MLSQRKRSSDSLFISYGHAPLSMNMGVTRGPSRGGYRGHHPRSGHIYAGQGSINGGRSRVGPRTINMFASAVLINHAVPPIYCQLVAN